MAQSKNITQVYGALRLMYYLDNNGARLINVADPVDNQDVVTKIFLENSINAQILTAGTGISINSNIININEYQPHIIGLGNVNTGTWSADTISISYGGTGNTNFPANKLVIGNGSNPLTTTAYLDYDDNYFKTAVPFVISDTSNATGSSLGSLYVAGGVNIRKDLIVSGTTIFTDLSVNNIDSVSVSTTSLKSANSTIGELVVTSLLTTPNIIVTNITASSLYVQNSIVTSSTMTNLNSSTITANNLVSTNISSTNLISTNSSISSLSTGNHRNNDQTSTNLIVTSVGSLSFANINTCSTGNLIVLNSTIANSIISSSNLINSIITTANVLIMSVGNLVSSNAFMSKVDCTLNFSSIATIGTLKVNGTSNIFNSNISTANVIYMSVGNLASDNLINSKLTTSNLQVNTLISSANIFSTNATLPTLISTNINTSAITSSNINVVNNLIVGNDLIVSGTVTAVNVTSINLIQNNITVGSLFSTNIISSSNLTSMNSTLPNMVSTNITTATINVTGITTSTLLATNIISSSNLTSMNSTLPNMVSTNITTATINVTGITTSTLRVSTLISAANVFSTNISAGELFAIDTTTSNLVATATSTGTLNATGITTSSLLVTSLISTTNLVSTNISSGVIISNPTSKTDGSVILTNNIGGGVLQFHDVNHSIWGRRTAAGGAGGIMQFRVFNNFEFWNGGLLENQTSKMVINSIGNVGINTSNPIEMLDIRGNIRVGGSTQANYIMFNGVNGDGTGIGGHTYIGERLWGVSDQSELLLFKGNDASTASGPDRIRLLAPEVRFDTGLDQISGTFDGVGTYGSTKMIIATSGNVGIGTNNPSNTLHIEGSMLVSGLITTTNLVATIASAGSLNASGITTSTLLVTNLISAANVFSTNISTSKLVAIDTTTSNLVSTASSTGSVNATGITTSTLLVTGLISASNVFSTNISASKLVVTDITTTNLTTNSLSIPVISDVPAIDPNMTNTLIVHEDFTGTTLRSGITTGTAVSYFRNTGNNDGYLELTPNAQDQVGSLSWRINPGNAFTITFDHSAGGGSRADLISFNWGGVSVPSNSTGYSIEFNENLNNIKIFFNGEFLTEYFVSNLDNGAWHRSTITFYRNQIRVIYDGVVVINYTDTTFRNVNGAYMYFYAFTGFRTNYHRIRNIRMSKLTEGLWQYQESTSGNIVYNGGNVGIGTSNPTAKLDVNGNLRVSSFITTSSLLATNITTQVISATNMVIASAQNQSLMLADLGPIGAWAIGAANAAMQYQVGGGGSGSHVFYTNSTTGASNEAMGIERMRINGQGNIGIGTNTPSTKLHVVGDVLVNGLITTENMISTNISAGTINSTSISVGNINITGSLSQNGSPYMTSQWTTVTPGSISYYSTTSNVYVGINNTDASYALDVTGNSRFRNNLNVSGDLSVTGNLSVGNLNLGNVTTGNIITNNINYGIANTYSASFIAANNVSSPANVTGLSFTSTSSFSINLTINIQTSSSLNLYASYSLEGLYKDGTWTLLKSYAGDATGIVFSITNTGQIQYTSTNLASWISTTFRYLVNNISSTGTYATLLNNTQGSYIFKTLQITDTTSSIVGTNNGALYVGGGATFDKNITIRDTANSSAIGSGGSLTVLGGSSVSKDLYVGQNIYAAGNILTSGLNLGISSSYSGSFLASNNISGPSNVTGMIFNNISSFTVNLNITLLRSVGSNLYCYFSLEGNKNDSGWSLLTSYSGDDTGIIFTITSGGQLQYTSTNISNWVSSTFRYNVTQISNTGTYASLQSPTQGSYSVDTIQLNNTSSSILGTSNGALYSLGGATFEKSVSIKDTTDSSGVQTGGALTILGGASISKNVYMGSKLIVTGDITSFGTISDIRFKSNIQNLINGLDIINSLRPVTFTWNDDIYNQEFKGRDDVGFVAQEVEKVIPYAVDDFSYSEDGELYKKMRHERIIPYLVEAIKVLTEKVNYLEAQVKLN